MAHLLGDLIEKLKRQLHLTSVVVTHDMRLAQKLADRIVFLHEARVAFFGTPEEMRESRQPIIREFLRLDEMTLGDLAAPCATIEQPDNRVIE
jgi:phospholipid/cholesterol/gamma-HCH transport system ATP-binding protein